MPSNLPLLAEWSPGSVRLLDPATGATARGETLAECAPERGREVVVAVGRRSAFVRALPVPAAGRAEVERIVGLGLMGSLPLEPRDTVFGYRLSPDRRAASVGAMRAESLVRLVAEAQAAGLKLRAVVPVAYGAWLAAKERGLSRCAVVSWDEGVLGVDVVEGGELVYSRAVPAASDEAEDEILRTLATAGAAPSAVLALAAPEVPAELHDARDALARLADLRTIDRELFSIELPARREARLARARRWRVQRALAAGIVALATVGYAGTARARAARPAQLPKGLEAAAKAARRDRDAAVARADAATKANKVLDVAFGPAQTATDVLSALANAAPRDAWVTALSVARGAPASVAGYALRGKDVTAYFDAVAKDPRFQRMQVVSTSVATVAKTPVVQFALSGDAVGTPPFDRPLKHPKEKPRAKA